ncbi:LysR substrate-binding domain-containing protein [Bradyrhizobium sp. Leo121]|uniref:LysR substrate-binding domain-containing protein n=1 Tax=Bradyrhizobium sp. Leo121 TaxID=1571195 RepID=UPI001FE16CE8|nr:LysR substrate-binding domain-containing protein [Bradyrhizobium sp. Leo121]
MLQRQSAGVLTVSTSPDFAAKWLVHWLRHFAEAHSGIDVRVSVTMHHADFAREEVDLAAGHGDGNWPGLDAVRLCSERLIAVCSPKLLSGRRYISGIADILKFPLIHLDSRSDWANWLRGLGIHDADVTHRLVLDRASMVIDAAINGQGIALARTTLAAWDLINGRLMLPFPQSLPVSKTYWIVCPKVTASLPKVVTFREWLLAEASNDLRQFKSLAGTSKARRRKGQPPDLRREPQELAPLSNKNLTEPLASVERRRRDHARSCSSNGNIVVLCFGSRICRRVRIIQDV